MLKNTGDCDMRDYGYIDKYLDILLPHIDERMKTVDYRMAPDHIWYATETLKWVLKMIKKLGLRVESILDVGCADGYMVERFNKLGKKSAGVTVNEKEIELCRQRGVNVMRADMSFLPVEESTYDMVWCRDCLEHSVMPLLTLFEFNRVLKIGGIVIVVVPTPGIWTVASNHYSVLTDKNWRWLFEISRFELLGFRKRRWIGGEMQYIIRKKQDVLCDI